MGASTSLPTIDKPSEFLSLKAGTLCAWCDDGLKRISENGEPYRTRALADLLEASKHCHYCAMWMEGLRQSWRELKEDGQVAAFKQHPLAQNAVDPKDVKLQFINYHDWQLETSAQYICWPFQGHMWAKLDLVPAELAVFIYTNQLANSDKTVLIKEWLKRCESKHNVCKVTKDPSWKPSRLLHLSSEPESLQIRLVNSDNVPERVEYLTVSHNELSLGLTKENLEEFKKSIPTSQLSRSFISACEMVRTLGKEYVWIDSLCVIQDDPEDEADRMAFIWERSWLHLVAHSALDEGKPISGVHVTRDESSWLPIWVSREWGGPSSGDYCVSRYDDWWTAVSRSPVNKQALTIEARILAPRVLHLGLEQLMFECGSMSVCERLPLGRRTSSSDPVSALKSFITQVRNDGLEHLTRESLFNAWGNAIRVYGQARLAVGTDKLAALRALADAFHPAFKHLADSETEVRNQDKDSQKQETVDDRQQDLFIAGLWRPYLEMQLAWRATSNVQRFQLNGLAPMAPGKRYNQYVAPSWSWCSLKDALIEPQGVSPIDIYFASVLDVKTMPSSDHGSKEAPRSSLYIQGSIIPIAGLGKGNGMKLINFETVNQDPNLGWKGKTIDIDSKNYWDVDFDEEAAKCQGPFAVPIFADMTRTTKPLHCLVLDRRDDEKGMYAVRLGAFLLDNMDDVKAFWKSVGAFNSVSSDGTKKCDGLFRFVETDGRGEYKKADGVLQRAFEVR
ncbi:uncharacterized protein FIESC28_01527 [Fusarium coffeatum]|uniref:Heterokaryon incompatibility domain-containing protein n=1 Tax=Fusarium coffeatum TaxID=231269 RepID=A0A366S8C4_9HYPO|nr:uncharacterized protein FIESC28_01527 [Fusarium coffeatum]RBR25564.1 hypothetical protein FIESC28_01527 [Fusarium coffeatum]